MPAAETRVVRHSRSKTNCSSSIIRDNKSRIPRRPSRARTSPRKLGHELLDCRVMVIRMVIFVEVILMVVLPECLKRSLVQLFSMSLVVLVQVVDAMNVTTPVGKVSVKEGMVIPAPGCVVVMIAIGWSEASGWTPSKAPRIELTFEGPKAGLVRKESATDSLKKDLGRFLNLKGTSIGNPANEATHRGFFLCPLIVIVVVVVGIFQKIPDLVGKVAQASKGGSLLGGPVSFPFAYR